MANTIQIKRSTTAATVPTLAAGELGVNLTDDKLWIGDGTTNLQLNTSAPDSYTKLLIHSDTTDGRGTFTDSSPSGHAISTGGDPTHETEQSKFGASSMYFDIDDYIEIDGTLSDFTFEGDFTIDLWLYRTVNTSGRHDTIMGSSGTGWRMLFNHISTHGLKLIFDAEYGQDMNTYDNGSLNTWHHYAFTRASGTVRVFMDGVLKTTRTGRTETFTPQLVNGKLRIGDDGAASYDGPKGYIDEFRISKGIARWTAAFTPPTRPYATFSAGDGVFTGELLTNGITSTGNFNLTGGGSVGIGTASPGYPLDVQFSGDSGIRAQSSNSHASIYLTSAASSSAYLRFSDGANRYWLQASAEDKLHFRPNATTATANQIIFDSVGKIGVGISPSYKLDVNGTANIGGALTVSGTTNLGGTWTNFGGGYGATGVSISNTGNIQANGTLTVDGALTGTTATFSVSGSTPTWLKVNATSGEEGRIQFQDGGTSKWAVGNKGSDDSFIISAGAALTTSPKLTISSAGAATFSGDIAADNITKNAWQIVFDYDGVNRWNALIHSAGNGTYTYDQTKTALKAYNTSSYIGGLQINFGHLIDSDVYTKLRLRGLNVLGKIYIKFRYHDDTLDGSWKLSGWNPTSWAETDVSIPAGKLVKGLYINSASSITGAEWYIKWIKIYATTSAYEIGTPHGGGDIYGAKGVLTGALTGTSAAFSSDTTPQLKVSGGNAMLELDDTTSGSAFNIFSNGNCLRMARTGAGGYPASYFELNTTGQVGIGVASGTYQLNVGGSGNFSGALTGTSATFSGLLSLGGTGSLGSVTTNQKILANFDGGYSTNNSAQNKVIGFIGTTVSANDIFDSGYGTSGELSKNFYLGLSTGNSYFNNAKFVIVQGGVERFNMAQGGDSTFSGAFTIQGDTSLENLYVNQESDFDGHVRPYADSAYTLGTNALRWSTIYGDAGNFSGALTGTSATFSGNAAAASLSIYSGGSRSDTVEGKESKYFLTGMGAYDGLWKKVCDVTVGTGLYKALAMKITLESQGGNFGNTQLVSTSELIGVYYRSSGTQNDQNTASLSGQNSDYHQLRIIKTATGVYELQILMLSSYKDALVKIEVLSANYGAVTITSGIVNGSTSGTVYSAVASDSPKNLYNAILGTTATFSGNVAIGGSATSPANWTGSPELIVEGTQPLIALRDESSGTEDYVIVNDQGNLRFYNDTDGIFTLNLNGDGNVGIGTNAPTQLLEVSTASGGSGNSYFDGAIKVGGNSATSGGFIGFNRLGSGQLNFSSLNDSGGANNKIQFGFGAAIDGTPATHAMTLNQLGKVGIGTNAPGSLLQLKGDGTLMGSSLTVMDSGSNQARFYGGLTPNEHGYLSLVENDGTTGSVYITGDSAGTNWILGKVGIGTAAPAYELEVAGTISNYGDGKMIRLRSDDYIIAQMEYRGTGANYDKGYFRLFDTGTTKVVLDSAGNSYINGGKVGIGTDAPASLLDLRTTRAGSITSGTGHTGTILTLHNEAQWESAYATGGSTPDFLGGIEFSTGDNSTGEGVRAAIRVGVDSYYNTNSLNFYVASSNSTTLNRYLRINSVGTATFSGALTGTSAAFSGAVSGTSATFSDTLTVATPADYKVTKFGDDTTSHYKLSGQADHTLTLTCPSYFQAEVIITAHQTNGGTYNNLYIRGIWSNNHTSHHWDEIENIGSLSGSTFTITNGQNGSTTNSGELKIFHDYVSASFSSMTVRVVEYYGTHAYAIS